MRQLWRRGNCKFHVPTFIQNGGRLGAGEKFIEIGGNRQDKFSFKMGGGFYWQDKPSLMDEYKAGKTHPKWVNIRLEKY